MGMAHRAPPPTYNQTYYVTNESLARFRQLAEGIEKSDTDPSLMRALDAGVKESVGLQKYRNIMDSVGTPPMPALLVELPVRFGKGLYAVVRPNKFKDTQYKYVIASIQDEEQVTFNMNNGKWSHEQNSVPGKPLGTLAGKMPKHVIDGVINAAAEKAKAAEPWKKKWRIAYTDDDGPHEEIYEDRSEFEENLRELVEGGGTADMKVFEEVEIVTVTHEWKELKPKISISFDSL
jgi:hypothetical protein